MNPSYVMTSSAPLLTEHRWRQTLKDIAPNGGGPHRSFCGVWLWLVSLLLSLSASPGTAAPPTPPVNGMATAQPNAEKESVKQAEKQADPSVDLTVTEVRRLMERGWWAEARARLDRLPATEQAAPSTLLALLRAEVCYQQRDLPCALDALELARHKATPEDAARVAQLQRYVQDRVGTLELHLQQLNPVELIQETPSLDIHLQKLFDETQRTLKRLRPIPAGSQAKRPTLQGIRWRHIGTRAVLESPPAGPVIAEVWLPLGQYRIQGIEVELLPGLTRTVAIPLSAQTPPSPGVTVLVGARIDGASGELLSRHTRPTLELRMPLGPLRLELGAGVATVDTADGALELGYPDAQVMSPLFQVGLGWAMHSISTGPVLVEFSPSVLGLLSWTSGQFHSCWLEGADGTTLDTGSCITTDVGWSVQGGLSVLATVRGWQLRALAAGGLYEAFPLEPQTALSTGQWHFDSPPERGQLFSIGLSAGRSFGGRANRTQAGGHP